MTKPPTRKTLKAPALDGAHSNHDNPRHPIPHLFNTDHRMGHLLPRRDGEIIKPMNHIENIKRTVTHPRVLAVLECRPNPNASSEMWTETLDDLKKYRSALVEAARQAKIEADRAEDVAEAARQTVKDLQNAIKEVFYN